MADAEDAHDVLFEREQDTVVAQAETEGASHIAVERGYFAGNRASEMQYSFK